MVEKKKNGEVIVKWMALLVVVLSVVFSWGVAYSSLRAADEIQVQKIDRLEECIIRLTAVVERHEKHVILYEHKVDKKDKP